MISPKSHLDINKIHWNEMGKLMYLAAIVCPLTAFPLIEIELRAGGRCQALPPAEISIMMELPDGQIPVVRELIIREPIGVKLKKQVFVFNWFNFPEEQRDEHCN